MQNPVCALFSVSMGTIAQSKKKKSTIIANNFLKI
jgi:hypothetical protein